MLARTAVVLQRHGQQSSFFEGPIPLVAEQEVRHVVVSDEGIHVPVAIVIGEGNAHPPARIMRDAGLFRYVFELPATQIVIERGRQSFEVFRMAVDPQAARRVPAITVVGDRPLGIMHHQQVQFAVVVIVKPARGHCPLAARDSRLRGDVFELAIAQIAIQNVAIHAGHEEIDIPVVIEIGCGDSHGISGPGHARLGGDIREFHAAIVSIQPVEILWRLFLERRHGRSVSEINVRAPVAVEVENRHAPRHGLDDVLPLRGAVVENEINPGACGGVVEPNGRGRFREE
jgi:hypothetical protein